MIFLNQIVMSINIIYSKTEINHLLISEKLKIKPDLLLKYRNHLLTKLITETNKNKIYNYKSNLNSCNNTCQIYETSFL